MKLKALVLALFVAGLTASYAVAGNGHGNGPKTGTATTKAHPAKPCKPKIELQASGTVSSYDANAKSLVVAVAKGRAQGAKLDGDSLTIDASKARVRGDLAANAKVRVHARACVDFSQTPATVTLWATQVRVTAAP
jgi:hypothetical protein